MIDRKRHPIDRKRIWAIENLYNRTRCFGSLNNFL